MYSVYRIYCHVHYLHFIVYNIIELSCPMFDAIGQVALTTIGSVVINDLVVTGIIGWQIWCFLQCISRDSCHKLVCSLSDN